MPIIVVKTTAPVYVEIDTDAESDGMVRSVVVDDENLSTTYEYLTENHDALNAGIAPHLDAIDHAWTDTVWPAWQFGW